MWRLFYTGYPHIKEGRVKLCSIFVVCPLHHIIDYLIYYYFLVFDIISGLFSLIKINQVFPNILLLPVWIIIWSSIPYCWIVLNFIIWYYLLWCCVTNWIKNNKLMRWHHLLVSHWVADGQPSHMILWVTSPCMTRAKKLKYSYPLGHTTWVVPPRWPCLTPVLDQGWETLVERPRSDVHIPVWLYI